MEKMSTIVKRLSLCNVMYIHSEHSKYNDEHTKSWAFQKELIFDVMDTIST